MAKKYDKAVLSIFLMMWFFMTIKVILTFESIHVVEILANSWKLKIMGHNTPLNDAH